MPSSPLHPVRTHFARLIDGRKCILAVGPVAGSTRWVTLLRELGAAPLLVLGEGEGTGVPPAPEDARAIDLVGDTRVTGIMEGVRAYERLLADPPPDVRRLIDDYDPDGDALYIAGHTTDVTHLLGRPRYAPRLPEWAALEDKVVVDRLWDAAGIARAPSRVVPADLGVLRAAAAELDAGDGTAWAGDAREGFNGGAEYVRWIRTDGQAERAAGFFADHCDRVRVMPWLEGIPCSIHGIVFPDRVVAVRPFEMMCLRRPDSARLQYAGIATYWDPTPDDREAMRDTARVVGEAMRRDVGYRGGFTVDGVMTADGFRPTELNARAGAGLNVLGRHLPELPLLLLALTEGEPLELDAAAIETALLNTADGRRAGGAWALLFHEVNEPGEHPIRWTPEGTYRRAEPGETADGALTIGPATTGGFLRFEPAAERTPAGPSLAPRAVAAFALADRMLDAGLGPLEAAKPVR